MKQFRNADGVLAIGLALMALYLSGPSLSLADEFQDKFTPFATKYCAECHNDKEARGELNVTRYTSSKQVIGEFRRFNSIIEFIRGGEMPPEDAPQPTLAEREAVVEMLEAILLTEAKKHAGDPGVVLPRRLSNTEYDTAIRDLTGVEIRPTREFPPDPAAGEGFNNTAEALSMSPSLLRKYLSSAQHVSEHLVLTTSGIRFAPFPVTSYNERKKLTEQAIVDFYQQHDVQPRDYVEAAWRYRHRGDSDRDVSISAWGERSGLSAKYLSLVWETLQDASEGSGYLKQLGQLWDALPPPQKANAAPAELATLMRFIEFVQRRLNQREEALIRSNAGNWPIAHLDFRAKTAARRDQFDASRWQPQHLVRFDRLRVPQEKASAGTGLSIYLRVDRAFDDGAGATVIVKGPLFSKSSNPPRNADEAQRNEVVTLRAMLEKHSPDVATRLAFGKHPGGDELDADSFAIAAPSVVEISLPLELLREIEGKQLLADCELDAAHRERSVHLQYATGQKPEEAFATSAELLIHSDSNLAKDMTVSAERFCRAFPNRFFYVDRERGLAAGFHLVEGFFRDDQPLVEKVLAEHEREELDKLWTELDFITQSTETLLRGFVWFERAERHVLHDARFNFLRAEDPKLVNEELLAKFERLYLEKLGVKLVADQLQPEKPNSQFDLVHGFFEEIRTGLAKYQEQLRAAEHLALSDVQVFARRAYRRPLGEEESQSLQTLYQNLRKQGQGVEGALRGVLAAVLMSPEFFLHFTESAPGTGVYPLSDDDLASRLSFFLWSSIPDEELLSLAAAGKLHDERVLLAQTRRMLRDDKIGTFAREFFGQWLRYRDYLDKDTVSAETFPGSGYGPDLRAAMFEEPIRLATHLIQEDQPITELLRSDTTFVNGVLAKHYGDPIVKQYQSRSTDPSQWHRVDGLRDIGRGGLFGMGVVLAKNSAGERTSPIKRGFWTVHHLLGQHFPPPPADVPELPPGEKAAKKTIRELITEHTANSKCALCHVHFDSLGMALEGFDAIGRARTKDLAGRPIDDVAVLPSGETAKGIPGLIEYIEQHRRKDFVRNLCRKFLGYALGRSVLLSDQPLLMEMEAALEKNDYRFSVLFETVVKSPQFRNQRGSEFVAAPQR